MAPEVTLADPLEFLEQLALAQGEVHRRLHHHVAKRGRLALEVVAQVGAALGARSTAARAAEGVAEFAEARAGPCRAHPRLRVHAAVAELIPRIAPPPPQPARVAQRDAEGSPYPSSTGFAAVYSPEEDRIQLPEPELLAEGGSYYATSLHELIQGTSRR